MKKNPFHTIPNIFAIAAAVLVLGIVFAYAAPARAFNGPSQAPPNGTGAIGSDSSNNISIGTSTTISGTKLLVVGASSDNTTYGEQILESNNAPIFILRDDGSVSIETSTISAGNTVIGNNLTVGGILTANNLGGSTITAGNVSSGQFGSNTGGGNYSFSGNVGIGTAVPDATLDVNGSSDLLSSGVGGKIFGDSDALNYYIGHYAVSGSDGLDIHWYGGVRLGDSTGPVLQITNGNVGIGTTAPGATLDVVGNIRSSSGFVYNAGSGNPWYLGGTANGPTIMLLENGGAGGPSNRRGSLGWMDNAGNRSEFLTWTDGGNVGIGTTTPAYTLDVNGAGSFEGNQIHNVGTPTAATDAATKSYVDSAVATGVTGGISGTTNYLPIFTGTNTIGNSVVYQSGGNVGIGTTAPGAPLEVRGNGTGVISLQFNADGGSGGMSWLSSTGSTLWTIGGGLQIQEDEFAIDHEGTNFFYIKNNGNVGIGTTAPLQLLNVNGASGSPATSGTTQGGTFALSNSNSYSTLYEGNYTASPYAQWIQSSGRNDLSVNYPIVLQPNGGNVGIGTTAPAYTLDVAGTGNFTGVVNVGTPTAASNAATKSYVDSAVSSGVNGGVNGTANYVPIFTGTNTIGNSVIYQSGGNVGIGTTGPVLKLDVRSGVVGAPAISGTTQTYGITRLEGGDNGVLDTGEYGTGGNFWLQATDKTTLASVYNISLNPNGGNVGIGTAAPAYTLDVAGTGNFTGVVNVGTPTAASNAATKSYVDSAVSSGVNGGVNGTANYVPIFTGTNTIGNSVIYQSGGNVGIGTTAPAYKLDVQGGQINTSGGLCIAGVCQTSWTNSSLNTLYVSSVYGSERDYLLANLPVSNPGSGDAVYIQVTGITSSINGKGILTVALGQRGGFWYVKNLDSDAGYPGVFVRSYLQANGTTNVYVIVPANSYYSAVVTYYQYGWGATLYNPATQSATVGTLNFDSTNDAAYPINSSLTYQNGYFTGNVGIGTTAPAYTLDVNGVGNFNSNVIHNVGTPVTGSDAANKSYVDTVFGGGSSNGNFATLTVTGTTTLSGPWNISGAAQGGLNLNGYNITGVNTLAVTTIDPSYQIGGTNYETFAPSIAGVQDEVTGNGTLVKSGSDYEYAINFPKLTQGSDLWVWYQTVDFSKDTVEAIATPYGQFAEIYYTISGSTLTFHGNAPAQFSFRLTGKRFDWQKWPTQSVNQSETPGFVLPVKD